MRKNTVALNQAITYNDTQSKFIGRLRNWITSLSNFSIERALESALKSRSSKRYILLDAIKTVFPMFDIVAALFVMSLGIALVTRGNLGTTPISSLPLVSSYASGLTFGETTFFINLLFVAAQWLLLRKSINKLLLLSQIPITFAFSYFIDTSMQITEFLSSDIYVNSSFGYLSSQRARAID